MSYIQTLNEFIEKNQGSSAVNEYIQLINEVPPEEQGSMHSELTPTALKAVFNLRDDLQLDYSVKEHIVWWYLEQRFNNALEDEFESLFSLTLIEYEKNEFSALESLIISLINKDALSDEQLGKVLNVFDYKALEKSLAIRGAKIKIKNGEPLDSSEITKLINLKAFDFLELALKGDSISNEDLYLFTLPESGIPNKKMKLKLFDMAQTKLQKLD